MTTFERYPNMLLALAVWREARGESQEARRAVAHVIRNRVRSPAWPNTVPGVVFQRAQFTSFSRGDANATLLPDPQHPADWQAWQQCCALADDLGPDITGGATHYHSCKQGEEPSWAAKVRQTATIGSFRFYA